MDGECGGVRQAAGAQHSMLGGSATHPTTTSRTSAHLADARAHAVPGLAPRVHAPRRLDHRADRQVAVLRRSSRGDGNSSRQENADVDSVRRRASWAWPLHLRLPARPCQAGSARAAAAAPPCSPPCWQPLLLLRLTCVLTRPMVTPVYPANAACTALCASTCLGRGGRGRVGQGWGREWWAARSRGRWRAFRLHAIKVEPQALVFALQQAAGI